MEFTFKEKSLVLMFATTALAFGYYFIAILPQARVDVGVDPQTALISFKVSAKCVDGTVKEVATAHERLDDLLLPSITGDPLF